MKVSIIGLGWFGESLGEQLKVQHEVLGTTRSEDKARLLREKGFNVFILDYPKVPTMDLLNSDVVVLNIPPRAEHLEWMKLWPWQKGCHVIFISSTSVYGDHQGTVDENTPPEPDTESGKTLLAQEKFFGAFSTGAIIRFGGLLGSGRHPGKYLSGRKNLEGAERPVNLVHQKDTVGFVKTVIEKKLTGIFNLVHPDHPEREIFYRSYCERKGLPLPEFLPQAGPAKTVNSSTILKLYQFQASLEED